MSNTVEKSFLYLIQMAVSGLLVMVLMPIISQYLTSNELGQFVLAQIYIGIAVGLANFGMLIGYQRNFFIFEKSNEKSAQLISTAVVSVFCSLSLLSVFIYIYQADIAKIIFSDDYPSDLLLVVFVGTSASSLSQYYLTYLNNSGLAKNYLQYTLLYSIAHFLIAVPVLVWSSLGAMSLAYAWTASNLFLFFLLLASHVRKLPIEFNVEMLREMLKISIPLTPRVFFGSLNTQADKVLIGLVGSDSAVGIYHIGQTIALFIFQFMTGLGRVFQPEVYRKLFAKAYCKHPDEINDYILPFFYFSILVSLLIAALSNEFLLWFFSEKYQSAMLVIVILAMYYSSLFFGKITGAQLIYAKKTLLSASLSFVGIILNIALNIPFIIQWGIIGAAWATAITGFIMVIVGYLFAQKYVKITWRWKAFAALYSVFLLTALWALINYHNIMHINYFVDLSIRTALIASYVFLGFKLRIVDSESIRNLLITGGPFKKNRGF